MEAPSYTTLQVPRELVLRSTGLSLDFGSTLLKIVYRDEDDYKEALNSSDSNPGRLRLARFPKTQVTQAFQFIKQHAHILRDTDGKAQIYTTGISSAAYATEINEILNVRSVNIFEADCFVQAFVYLSQLMRRQDLLMAVNHDAVMEGIEEIRHMLPPWKATIEKRTTNENLDLVHFCNVERQLEQSVDNQDPRLRASNVPLAKAEEVYPCLLVMLGSAFGFMKVSEDGSFVFADNSYQGGRTLHGLGSILTGTQDFNEFLDLAEKGNAREVNMHYSEAITEDNQRDAETRPQKDAVKGQDIYQEWFSSSHEGYDPVLFYFGKGIIKDDSSFRREDLAIALLGYFITELAMKTHLMALKAHVKHVFLAGSLMSSALVRQIFTRQFVIRNLLVDPVKPEELIDIKFDIVEPGSQLGAIGALLNSVHKFL